jgi:hypothetical protein
MAIGGKSVHYKKLSRSAAAWVPISEGLLRQAIPFSLTRHELTDTYSLHPYGASGNIIRGREIKPRHLPPDLNLILRHGHFTHI